MPIYWVRPSKILSAEAGMHRFVWDLHAPLPDSMTHDYPISAIFHDTPRYPLGAAILPGQYTVKLTVGEKSFTQPLTVRMDPRVKTLPAGIAQEYALATRETKAMGKSFKAVEEVKGVRAQLKKLQEGTGDAALPKALADAASALDKKLASLEGSADEDFTAALLGGKAPNFPGLNGQFGRLLAAVDGADAAPTTQAVAVTSEMEQSLEKLLAQWGAVKSQEIAALSKQLEAAHLPGIRLEKTAAEKQ